MPQEVAGLLILIPLSVCLWLRVGMSTGKARSQAWAAVSLLSVMWTIQLASLGRLTAIATAVNAVVFCVITLHRYRHDYPDSRYARWYERLPGADDE